ncbi:MAG: hypothetical protein INR73_10160 [Williamsia sp.]|nr:hypothetical protein [Williamsia sp.]
MKKWLPLAELVLIVCLALFPLAGAVFPYRLNIFLSYEGAYRLYLGEVPYKDFGLPMGFMYWVIPALFFKLFGPYMISLVKAQVFINIVSGLAFRSILKSFGVRPGIRFLSVLLFCISYSFLNYWPWYNHTVIVYELVALAFLTRFFFTPPEQKKRTIYLCLSGAFVFLSFFTKQDAGAMGFLVCVALLAYNSFRERKWLQLPLFLASMAVTAAIFVVPFLKYGFGYWFNYGQPPHTSRFSLADFTGEFFNSSQWLKFYFFLILFLLVATTKNFRALLADKRRMIFILLTLGMLTEATIFQVTSYIPPDNNIFFHSFAFAFLLVWLADFLPVNWEAPPALLAGMAGIMLWWSSVYWKYLEKYIVKPSTVQTSSDVVTKNTYLIFKPDSSDVPMSEWRTIPLPAFRKMLLPGPTVDGINRIMQMNEVKKRDAKVLNMTELTPLAREIPFTLERGSYYPLWYHKGVGMFQKQTDMFCNRIKNNYYDLVLFEYIPYLNNFYPFQVRDTLLQYYQRIDTFTAPRKPSLQAWVEVYVRKK